MQRGFLRLAVFAALIAALVATGCGGDGADDELIRFEGLPFISSSQSETPEEAVPQFPGFLLIVEDDGTAVFQIDGEEKVEFRVPDADLSQLRSDLEQLDFQGADERYGGLGEESPQVRLTYDGTTLELGSRYFGDFRSVTRQSPLRRQLDLVYYSLNELTARRLTDAGPPPEDEIPIELPSVFDDGKRAAVQSGCLACHRIASAGNDGPGPDLTQIGSRLSEAEIKRAIVKGPGVMPSYRAMKDDQPLKFIGLVEFLERLR